MKNRPCAYCKREYQDHFGASDFMYPDGFCFHARSNNPVATYIPCDNLTYVEHLAKQRHLVI
jgi:hypothetical protein